MISANISEDTLDSLTVSELKLELRKRAVAFTSKLRKSELIDLLRSSLHLPVVSDGLKNNNVNGNSKKKAKCWRTDNPVRQLLYFEFKEENIPLDPNLMGPAEIYCKYHNTEEFQGLDYNDDFIQSLKSLRNQIKKEEPLLKWDELHPTRELLFSELGDGMIPDGMAPEDVWSKCSNMPQFQLRGIKFNDTFKRQLRDLRKLVKRDKNRAEEDMNEVRRALRNHPPPSHNHRGEPQWNGSEAKTLLKADIAEGKHLIMKPGELQLTKPQYQEFEKDTFRWKIRQEVRTKKYLHTLKHDAEQKLRKNLKKMSVED